jgi:hypothetical protein
MSEVEQWLESIGAAPLYRYFCEDGLTTLDSVRNMRQSDIDAIVDRRGYMVLLNEEIDLLNSYNTGGYGSNSYHVPAPRAVSFIGHIVEDSRHESRDDLMNRYASAIPRAGSVSRSLARQSKSRTRQLRGGSAARSGGTVDRYIPNSASDAYEQIMNTRRAKSVAATAHQNARLDTYNAAEAALNDRKKARQFRAQSEIMHSELDHTNDALNRGKFRDHYTNEFVWVEKNHITDVGVKYDGLSRRVDHKPSHWRCEDEIERGKEYKRMNDECADKIADNRFSIDNSRDWLVNDGGVIDRVHRMSAKTAQTRYDLDSIKRNMENLKAMRNRLLKY